MKKIGIILVVSASFLFLNSCSTEQEEQYKNRFNTGDPYKEILLKLKNYSLSLEIVPPKKNLKAGEEAIVTFKLTNTGKKPLVIYEWMMNEEDNVGVYYIPASLNISSFDEKKWKSEIPSLPEKPKRAVLTLNPKNTVFIDKNLKFIKDMVPEQHPATTVDYMLAGKLNLATVSVQSPIAIITVSK